MEKDQLSRKLAVILHADVVGSTSLVQLDEALAHQRVQSAFRRFTEIISSHGGIAHEVRGDALLAEFGKASDALFAATSFQAANTAHIDGLADDVSPVIRVGIALGEVVVADGTITGEGVVLAQRLEQLAKPGGVCIQDAAYQTVPRRLPFEYQSLGENRLKGFDEPVKAYSVRPRPEHSDFQPGFPTDKDTSSLELPDKPSIAVLPFTNISGDPEQEYFADGITEDIITALSQVANLLVVARNSTMVYKGKSVDIGQVGREQGVRFVLEGSVRREGNRVRVTAQLIDAITGHHQWAERYDRNLDDIFAVQDDITHRIIVETRVRLTDGEHARLTARRTENLKARELILRADELNGRFVREANLQARELCERALKLDPTYTSAWALLGWTHWEDACLGWTETAEVSQTMALEAAQKALELEEDYPEALALLGHIYPLLGEHDRAVEVTEKAFDLSPTHFNTAFLATVLTYAGKADEAVELFKKSIRLSPLDFAWLLSYLGMCYCSTGDFDLAISTLRRAVALEPDSTLGRAWLTSALISVGMNEKAEQVARDIMNIDRRFSASRWRGAQFKDVTLNQRVLENLRKAGLPD